jgi:hypothetical protein
MATASALGTNMSLAEIHRRENPDGTVAKIIDTLSQENHILDYITWIECNNGDYHEDTQTASEPAGSERAYDEGVSKEAGVTEKLVEPTCMLDGISEVDSAKARRFRGGVEAYRLQEAGFFLRGMTKTMVSRLFDGDRSTYPRRIYGINQRSNYNALSSSYVFDNAGGNASATANKTSVYFIQFGEKKVNLIYPLHGEHGDDTTPIKTQDFGESIINQSGVTGEAKKYPAWQMWFSCDFGLFIHDPRCIKRIVNISTSSIDGVDDFAWHEDPMIDAYNELEYNGEGCVILCNRTVLAQAQKRANEKGNAFFTMQQEGEGPFARPVVRFMGIPMQRVDQITNTQATVT